MTAERFVIPTVWADDIARVQCYVKVSSRKLVIAVLWVVCFGHSADIVLFFM